MAIKLIYPVNGPITQYFGEHPEFYQQWGYAGHNGLDFGVPNGTPIAAAADGTVVIAGADTSGYGNLVKLTHMDGGTQYMTYYAHLQSILVTVGQQVKAGTIVGLSNNTGTSTGPHLHFGIKINGQNPAFLGYLDPLPFLNGTAPTPSTTPPTSSSSTSSGTIPSSTSADSSALAGAIDLPNLSLTVIVDSVNVRSGPGTDYSIVDQLATGAQVTATGLYSMSAWTEFQPGKWCALTYNASAFAKITGNSGASPVPVSSATGAIPLPGLNVEITDLLKVRTGPGPQNPDVALLNPGDKIVGGQIFAARAWIQIGKDRWVALVFDGTPFLKFN